MRIVLLLVAGLGLAGCTAMLLGDGRGGATAEAPTARTAAQDNAVTAAVRRQFNDDSVLSGRSLRIETTHGRVTLYGTVADWSERDRAVRLAARVDGVQSVTSRIDVKPGT